MKKFKYIITFLAALVLVGCDTVDFGDTNKNPNGATDPYTAGLLSSAIMSYATYTGRDGLMKPTLYVQYQAQVTYTDEMFYAEAPSSWYTYYVSTLSALQKIIDFVSDPDNQTPALLSQGSVGNQTGVAMIFKAIVMKRITDTYGDIPFSQALQGLDNVVPAYDKQEDVYKGIIDMLKAGRDMLSDSENPPTGDIIYDGDVSKWGKLANSVILQASLQLSKQFPSSTDYAATEFKSALGDGNGVIETLSDEAWFHFEDVPGFQNPWNQNRTPDYFATQQWTDDLHGITTGMSPTSNHTADPRANVYLDVPTADGIPYGLKNGSGSGKASVSNEYYWNNTTPLPLMTASYTFLNRADAANLGWTNESKTAMLTQGIMMDFATLQNLSAAAGDEVALDGTTYAAARVADALGAVGFTKVIGEEKWVSLFGQAFDAWSEWRRTGIPNLKPPTTNYQNSGVIPRRYLYPIEENTLNSDNYDAGVAALSPATDKNSSKVWWDQ